MTRVRHHQKHHAERPDAADPDHFDGRIHQVVAIEQNALILGQRFTILRQRLPDQGQVAGGSGLVRMEDRRRDIVDAGSHRLHEPGFAPCPRCCAGPISCRLRAVPMSAR
jgi:hypothetical protein